MADRRDRTASESQKALCFADLALAISFIAILSTLTLISKLHDAREFRRLQHVTRRHPEVRSVWHVTLSGAVAKPGCYPVTDGAPLSVALKKARLMRSANLRSIDPSLPVTENLDLSIEELSTLSVTLEGAVCSAGPIEMPVGSRLSHLKTKIEGTAETDWAFFKSRRLLRDGEVVSVPFQTGACKD
ncbi:MAG: SLBB domain-containing protein [Verrucomicrobiota bacterium]|nr:SLBB domain-containing protein [Verrucomicrobiota bacterium]